MKGTTNYTNLTNGEGILRLAPRMGTNLDCFTSFAMTQSDDQATTIKRLNTQQFNNEEKNRSGNP